MDQSIAGTAFWAYGQSLANVSSFKYLGRLIVATDKYCLLVVDNLRNVQRKWAKFSRILG